MRALATASTLTALLALAACGGSGPGSSGVPSGSSGGAATGYHGCTTDALSTHARRIAAADLDGDGSRERVLLGRSGPCAGSLLSVVDGQVVGTSVRGLRLRADSARAVPLRGTGAADLVLVLSGAQPHLFTGGGKAGLTELTRAGRPLLPPVGRDRQGAPMTAGCAPRGGVTVVTGKAHRPPGVVLAWDVTRTTYDVSGGRVVERDRSTVGTDVADPTLRRQMPGLFDRVLFDDCA